MPEVRDHIELNPEAIELGYKNSKEAVKEFYEGYHWMGSNLASSKITALDTVLNHAIRAFDLLDLESGNGLSLDIWHEIRDDISDAFLGKCTTVELAALIDTAKKYDIPKQFLFDPISGADLWIRNRKFKTFNELETFAANVGGSTLAAAIPVLGFVSEDYKAPAIEAGKAVFLTQALANCVNDAKQNRLFIAQEDIDDCELDVARLKLRKGGDPLKHLVRLYCSRIEKIMYKGGHVIKHLDYDGKRTVSSLLSAHWRMLMQMKLEPASVLNEEGVLSKRDLFGLKSRHLLGLEGNIPIIPADDGHDDHH